VSEDHEDRLMAHLATIPDPKEAFGLLDLLRDMGAITADDAAFLMSLYWEIG
jgi:hypothetical protein